MVRQPTAIPGAERKRIEVSVRDLRALSPGAAAVVYEYATITDLNLTTGDVTTTLLTNSFIVADIMRKTLATT